MKENELAERIKGVETEVKEINRRLDCNDASHLRIEEKIDKIPEKLAEQFAPKSVVNDVEETKGDVKELSTRFWWAVGIGISAVIGLSVWIYELLLGHVIQK